ncbi:FemAB family protein [Flavobacterium chuncheonense]|uniref:FemAB family protein n=1 Tax=Flavobacterium chuncheonense TaxID=2026653 RepID=A0ABW5YPM3_9FLAO
MNPLKNYIIKQYNSDYFALWNAFIAQAKNATFLFHRDFMEYHSDRFEDFSLMVFDEKNKLKAVLPANREGDVVFSHKGLTYGGLIIDKKLKGEELFTIMDLLLEYLKLQGFKKFIMKSLPIIYNKYHSSEIDFYLFSKKATIIRRDMNLAFPLHKTELLSKSKLKHNRKAKSLYMEIKQETNFSGFWEQVLVPRLLEKHQAKPVHSCQEIGLLANRFPNNIKQFNAYFEGNLVAGITVFENEKVVKSQYGATTVLGEKIRALDFLFFELFEKYKEEGKEYFDMGIVMDSTFKEGFNPGLLKQKEELGGVIFCQDYYELNLLTSI